MALILNIETATPVCSVSLADKGTLLSLRESSEEKSHARNLTLFLEDIFKEQGIAVKDLDAIAVGRGPGSYTGLRIGVAAAKGIAYGAKIPFIAISTLETIMNHALYSISNSRPEIPLDDKIIFCPMIDARRMEVYWTMFDASGNRLQPDSALIIKADTFASFPLENNLIFLGSGARKCKETVTRDNTWHLEDIFPSARAMCEKSYYLFQQKAFENIAYFEPFYLKDFVTTASRKKPWLLPTKQDGIR
jgi:tRNA threonylcarbamoyladenosine biosynthesis protein TsaB